MAETVLAIDQLTVYRETYRAVEDVSFQLEAGTDMAIVGPNGAGKSTLVQAILGILPYQSGRVEILGQTVSSTGKLPNYVRHQIAYMPQNFLFDRRIPLTVAELVSLGWERLGPSWPWRNRQARRQAVWQALAQVDALELRHKLINQLSGGETKRVLLAYCLVRPRRLLILDEAPAGLDVRNESEFYQLLYQLKQTQGWAILQISHDLEMIRRNCDRVICLNRRLLCQGVPEVALSPDNLATAYGDEFVRYRHHH